jgi:hypothetical protein
MAAGLTECTGPIAGSYEGLDHPECDLGIEGIQLGGLTPPVDRPPVVTACQSSLRQTAQPRKAAVGISIALSIDPALELRRILEKEAVQEPAAVHPDRGSQVSSPKGLLESGDIGLNELGIQPERLSSEEEGVAARLPPLGIEQLVEHVSGSLGVRLRPEIGDELVPTEARVAGDSEEGQDGKAPALSDGPGEVLLAPEECQAAKGA